MKRFRWVILFCFLSLSKSAHADEQLSSNKNIPDTITTDVATTRRVVEKTWHRLKRTYREIRHDVLHDVAEFQSVWRQVNSFFNLN